MQNLQAKAQKAYNQFESAIAKLDKKLIDTLYPLLDAVKDGQFPDQEVLLTENQDIVMVGIRNHEIVGREVYSGNVVDIDIDQLSSSDKNFIIGQIALGLDLFDDDDDDDEDEDEYLEIQYDETED